MSLAYLIKYLWFLRFKFKIRGKIRGFNWVQLWLCVTVLFADLCDFTVVTCKVNQEWCLLKLVEGAVLNFFVFL